QKAGQQASSAGSFGSTTAGIDTPLNSTELAVINNASNAYFEKAGLMLLNGSISGVFSGSYNVTPYMVGGKPSVVYLGSITCIYCGENRWAMALALGRFGSFAALYKGYSSFGDYDVPTLYWTQNNYTTPDTSSFNPNGIDIGNSYKSSYINFFSIDGNGQINQGFFIQPLNVIGSEVNATENQQYISVYKYLMTLQSSNATAFQGTPYTIWGSSMFRGADGVDFGNAYPPVNSTLPLTYMTHSQVLSQLANPNDTFAWREYAAADVYVARICAAIKNAAPVCSLSSIKAIEAL
ncbi:MAG: DUF929 family protein, partial [Candidatus Micrarchaeaceae archaeon]